MRKEKQIVRYRARITLGEKIIAGFLAMVLFLMLAFIVHNYATLYGLNVSIQQEKSVISEQELTNAGYQMQLDELSSPENVLDRAQRMGMESSGEKE
ncbi:hypothetical protein WZ76_20315 [Shouchella clausii]|nr:hypothetical protein WZ76_20315 [Shouchella clausii]